MRLAMNDINPAAEVRPASTLAERAARVRSMRVDHIRTSLEQAKVIGDELRAAKEQCVRENKPWLPWLQEAKVPRSTASEHMRISEHWSTLVDHVRFAAQGGVKEAIKFMAGNFAEEQEVYGQRETSAPSSGGSTNPAAGAANTPTAPRKLCDRCARKGWQVACAECAKQKAKEDKEHASSNGTPETPASPPEPEKPPEPPKDEAGHPIPETLLAAFETAAKIKEATSVAGTLQKLIDEAAKAPGGEQLARCTKPVGPEGKTVHKTEELEALKRHLKFTKPYSVCPWCKGKAGKTCKGCSGTGWVTKTTWDGAEDKVKEALA